MRNFGDVSSLLDIEAFIRQKVLFGILVNPTWLHF